MMDGSRCDWLSPLRYACMGMVALALLGTPAAVGADEPVRPNVIFIFIDDMGYGDLSCYGNKDLATPHIDRLAAEGTRFTQFYVASPICSPSRVACTTGRWPSRLGIIGYFSSRQANRRRAMPDYLDPTVPCIARQFQRAGYATGHFGKWHQGGGRDVDDAPLPKAYGFDESLVCFEGLGDRVLIRNDGLSRQSAKLGHGTIQWAEKHQLTEIYVNRCLTLIKNNPDKPFYVHLWLNDVHDPYLPRKDRLEQYSKRFDDPALARYYAVIDEMDRQIGRLLDALDRMKRANNTLVVLASDNGPTAWPFYYKQGRTAPGKTAGLRGRKWSLYEGGIRQPLLVRWPGHVPAGKVNTTTVVSSLDFFPTFCALAGLPLPAGPLDGQNMADVFRGSDRLRGETLYWDFGRQSGALKPYPVHDRSPQLALRRGDWKFLVNVDGSSAELYDLKTDPTESHNLAGDRVKLAASLKADLLGWLARVAPGR